MEVIRNIVKCTPEQYLELLKNGEVEVNGELKTYSENTLYDTGNLELLEWYNKMMEAQHKELQPAHTPYTMKTLEQEIADIIKEYPEYQGASCVGYRAYLKKGDIVGIKSTYNNGEWFINGKRVEANYSYNGDGTELVSVVGFDTKHFPVTLGATPSYYPFEIYIRAIGKTPEVSQYYYLYADKIYTYNFNLPVSPKSARVMETYGLANFEQRTPVVVQELYSDCEYYKSSALYQNTHIKKVSLPNCVEVSSTQAFSGCSNITTWEWGKLKKISGSTNISSIPFNGVNTLVIPDTVETITTGYICQSNKTIRLECNNATSIHANWCRSTPTNLYIADDWRATVNLAIAANNWTLEQFMDFAENKLTPINPNGGTSAARYLTIPASKASQLEELGFYNICEDKGWVVDEA